MFSRTVGSLFILMLFSLAMQKLFILMRSHLFILSFMSLALGDMSVRMLLHGMSEIFQYHLLKRLSLLHCMLLPPLSDINCSYRHEFLPGLSVLLHWSICLSYSSIRVFLLQCTYSIIWNQELWYLQLCSFLSFLWLFRVFLVPCKFFEYLFYFCEVCQ